MPILHQSYLNAKEGVSAFGAIISTHVSTVQMCNDLSSSLNHYTHILDKYMENVTVLKVQKQNNINNYHQGHGTIGKERHKMKAFFGVLLIIPLLAMITLRIYCRVMFDIECGDHMKLAAGTGSVELAKAEMAKVVQYLEGHGMTTGFTSIYYEGPEDDIGFFYKNVKSLLAEIEAVSDGATALEKSNMLMKAKEMLTHNKDGTIAITVPEGISIFPYNSRFIQLATLCFIIAMVGVVMVVQAIERKSWGY